MLHKVISLQLWEDVCLSMGVLYEGVEMDDHRYFELDKKTYARFGSPAEAFISQCDLKEKLPHVIAEYLRKRGELFLDRLVIATETLSPLARDAVIQLADSLGYHAECANTSKTGKYIGSDGGGHYSTDYYEILRYAEITVTPA